MSEERCSCRCHTFSKSCAGFGAGDNNCCSQPHTMWDEWKTRIDPAKKKELMAVFNNQADSVNSEGAINKLISDMDIPEHIKKVILKEFWFEGYHCANFDDVCSFDVRGNVSWAREVLVKFL